MLVLWLCLKLVVNHMKLKDYLDVAEYDKFSVIQRYSSFDSKLGWLKKETLLSEMPEYEVVEIDHVLDYKLVEDSKHDIYNAICVIPRLVVIDNNDC